MNFKGNFYMNFKKILFFVTFVLPSALFTSDNHPSKIRKFEKTAEKVEEAVKLPRGYYLKGDLLDCSGKKVVLKRAAFEVLETGPAELGYVYVLDMKKEKKGLFNPQTRYFATNYTYGTVSELLEYLKKRDLSF